MNKLLNILFGEVSTIDEYPFRIKLLQDFVIPNYDINSLYPDLIAIMPVCSPPKQPTIPTTI